MMFKILARARGAVVRPIVYMAFTRFVCMLTAVLLWNYFTNPAQGTSWAFIFMGLLFCLLAFIAYLRFDGVQLPKPMMTRVHLRKKPTRTYGDMIDHVDEELISFDDLETDEKDVCCFTADSICAILFLIASFF